MGEFEQRYVVMDIHGVTLRPKPLIYPQNFSRHISREEIGELIDKMKDPERLLDLTFRVPYLESIPSHETLGEIALSRRPLLEKLREAKRSYYVHQLDFFWTYSLASGVEAVYRDLQEGGVKINSCSGIPSCCASEFRQRMTRYGLWQHLDKDDPAFLTPSLPLAQEDWKRKFVHPMINKLAVYLYRNVENHARVVIIDDLPQVAQAGAILGAEVILVNPAGKDALNNGKQKRPDFFDDFEDKGVIIPVKRIEDVPFVLREIHFL